MKGLAGKNVLVTGGASGIGQAMAVRFAQEGTNVAINYLSSLSDAEQTHAMMHQTMGQIEEMGVKHVLIRADVSKED